MILDSDKDKVWCSVEMTLNMGNYENVKITMGESRTIDPEKGGQRTRKHLFRTVYADLETYANQIKDNKEGVV